MTKIDKMIQKLNNLNLTVYRMLLKRNSSPRIEMPPIFYAPQFKSSTTQLLSLIYCSG